MFNAMLYILYGSDDYSLGEYIDEIKAGLGDREMLKVNTSRLDGRKLTEKELADCCYAVPFLSPFRLIIVDGLIEQFESKKEKQQSDSNDMTRSGKRLKEWQSIEEIIRSMPRSTVLILVDADIKDKNPMLKKLVALVKELNEPAKKAELPAEIKVFPLLKGSKLRNWIKHRVLEENATISEEAVTLLIELTGSNLWTLNNEIRKLLLYVHGRDIDEKDVAELTDYSRETNIFVLVDAIVEGNIREAHRMLYQMHREGFSSAYILTMITRQIRLIALAYDLKPGLPKWQIQNKLGLVGYPLDKTLKQARSYDLEHIRKAYSELLQTDLAIKRGKYSDDHLALEIMLSSIGCLD
jgi:DNA polymerase-3 subunit delta